MSKENSQEQACKNEEEQRVVHQVNIRLAEPGKTGIRALQIDDPLLSQEEHVVEAPEGPTV